MRNYGNFKHDVERKAVKKYRNACDMKKHDNCHSLYCLCSCHGEQETE